MSRARRSAGRYFEDFGIGQHLVHAVPRTLHGGDISTYISLTGDRHPLASSTELARSLGFTREVMPDLLVFHIVFGKSVPDVSHNATANLGYADVRFLRPVYPGDTLVAETEVIGLREVSSGEAGVVYVRTRGTNQKGQEVLSFVRWVMVPKRDRDAAEGVAHVPQLPSGRPPERLPVPDGMNLQRFADLAWAMPPGARWDAYESGERIDHPDAMTIEEADHVQATRLYHNTAQVHFDRIAMEARRFGKRLVYGGHVISSRWRCRRTGSAPRSSSRRGTAARTSRRRSPAIRCARSPRSSTRSSWPASRRRRAALAAVGREERSRRALAGRAPATRGTKRNRARSKTTTSGPFPGTFSINELVAC